MKFNKLNYYNPFIINKILNKSEEVTSDIIPVYRLTKEKRLESRDFYSYIEEGRSSKNSKATIDPSYYACSVYEGKKGYEYLLSCTKLGDLRTFKGYIAKGIIAKQTGRVNKNEQTSHIDWWICDKYKHTIHEYFESMGLVREQEKEVTYEL